MYTELTEVETGDALTIEYNEDARPLPGVASVKTITVTEKNIGGVVGETDGGAEYVVNGTEVARIKRDGQAHRVGEVQELI